MFKFSPLDIARFWLKVKKYSNCWEWQGSLTQSGYGRYTFKQKTYRAHRIAYYIQNGTLSNEMFICHTCDNPRCVNPAHLFEASPKENTADMIRKGNLVREKPKKNKQVGVSYRPKYGKWRARKMVNYKNYLIGNFDTEEEAISAYLAFTLCA